MDGLFQLGDLRGEGKVVTQPFVARKEEEPSLFVWMRVQFERAKLRATQEDTLVCVTSNIPSLPHLVLTWRFAPQTEVRGSITYFSAMEYHLVPRR